MRGKNEVSLAAPFHLSLSAFHLINPVGPLDALDTHDRMDKRIDHPRTGNLDGDSTGDAAARSGVEIDGADVELQLAADGLGNVVGHTGGVGRDDTDSDAESRHRASMTR